ncbi:hypothetical protein GCM10022197_38420 [Microlunatus spumicola]|uniref:DUF998 domain-containing protein n=1 Tax=Microlunatus spumicola TaxID=81499 RepID=A0ABP6Y501_9ACTN
MTAPTSTGPTSATTPDPRSSRWTGAALLLAGVGFVVVEAVVAAAWDVRPYSYADDYVNVLGSRFVGEFGGYAISSPRWLLMDVGWVATGLLVAAAAARLARGLAGWRRGLVTGAGVVVALGLLVFAVVPLGPATIAAGLLPLYLAGAFGSIVAGNALAVAVGLLGRRLGLPAGVRGVGVGLGVVGLLSIPLTYGRLAIGVAERIPMYSFLAWAVLTGVALLVAGRPARSAREA